MPNEKDWIDHAISIFSAISSAIVALVAVILANRHSSKMAISERISKMIDIGMEYPFVEDSKICDTWPETGLSADDQSRYENYCCYVFNTLLTVWRHCGSEKSRFMKLLDFEELIWKHRCWWRGDHQNRIGYEKGFQNFIDRSLTNLEKNHGTNCNSN